MYEPAPSPASATSDQALDAVHLRGPWLTAGRVGWLALAALSLLLAGIALPQYSAQLHTVCAGSSCPGVEISPAAAQALQQAGFTIDSFAALNLSLTLLSALVWCAVGMFLFWRKSDEWCILVASLQAVLQGSSTNGLTAPLQYSGSLWRIPTSVVSYVGTVLILLIFALFPNGRFVPRWMLWIVLVSGSASALPSLWPNNPIFGSLGAALFFIPAIFLLGGQIYRYRRVSTPTQRQQTKWIVSSIATIILVQIVTVIPTVLVPAFARPGALYQLVAGAIDTLVLLIVPLAIAISLLRYRLWDIDTLINKAVVYGSLTGLLGGLYAGLIIGLTSLAGLVNSAADQPIVLVIATLTIAALFQPARTRIQSLIDRRFYRRKYDAEQTLSTFTATLQSEIDPNDLRAQLVAVVQETMQPTYVSLWLNSLNQRGPESEMDRPGGF